MNKRFPVYVVLPVIVVTVIMIAWAIRSPKENIEELIGAGSLAATPIEKGAVFGDVSGSGARGNAGDTSERDRTDPAYLRELMRQYAHETELDKRGALLAILQSVPTEEVKRFALQQADSSDMVTRQEGLALLSAFPLDDADVRGLLVGQIDKEQDPAMLKDLVNMLAPTMVPTEDAAPLVEQLVRLRQHPDPEVRAASVLQSSQWDKGGDIESTLHHAMLDSDTRVRQAAIAGITSERLHSDRLKDVLLEAAYDRDTDPEERNAAIFALEGFALNRAEYELYRRAGERVASDEEASGHSH